MTSNDKSNPTLGFTIWLFLRLLGVIYLIAFVSNAVQITALIGSDGLSPATRFLEFLRANYGAGATLMFPTLAWLSSSDFALQAICWGGAFASLFVCIGFGTLPSLAICYLLYLSITSIGQDFLSFQWDFLLLETGFAALFVTAPRLKQFPLIRKIDTPNRLMVWVLRMIIFKLMLMSGLAKLLSGDQTWASLTALNYHYETQPLPTPLGYFAGHLPDWFQKCSVAIMFFIELVVPFLIFINRRFRTVAAILFISLQLLIALTGNYTFFNWLTIALCLTLLDDATLLLITPKNWRNKIELLLEREANSQENERYSSKLSHQTLFFARFLIAASLFALDLSHIGISAEPLQLVSDKLATYGVSNGYGLFASMTTVRNEIIIEGSNDGKIWLAYELPYKPGDAHRAPPVVAPYQPRLDWQLWFASLSDFAHEEWFGHLMFHVMKGTPDVMRLFSHNPFPAAGPKFVRASFYTYRFTDIDTLVKTGEWWQRTPTGLYFPEASLTGAKQNAQPE